MKSPLAASALLLCVACDSSAPGTMSPPPDPEGCLAAGAPSEYVLGEGARQILSRAGLTNDATATLEATGGAELFSYDDRLILRAPYGDGSDASLRVTCSSGATHSIPLRIRRIEWTQLSEWRDRAGVDAPHAREYFAFWQDPLQTKRLWLYGGFVYVPEQFTPNFELWSFDLETAAWTAYGVLDDAPMTSGGRIERGPTPGTAYYHGGLVNQSETPRTFAKLDFTGTPTWTALDTTRSPPAYTGALVRDERRNRWLSIGGVNTVAGFNSDVYQYTEANGWSRVAVSGRAPEGRDGFAYGYDANADRVVLFGGDNGDRSSSTLGDTWSLTLGGDAPTWVRLFEQDEVDGIERRRNCAWAYDADNARLILWGGTPDGLSSIEGLQLLHLDPDHETWHAIETPEEVPQRTSGGGIYDAERKRVYWGFGNDNAIYHDLWSMTL